MPAKKKRAMPRPTPLLNQSQVRHIQIELPAGPYEQGKEVARANGLSMAAYVRQAILQRIREDLEQMGRSGVR
jgi:hypothetical protein